MRARTESAAVARGAHAWLLAVLLSALPALAQAPGDVLGSPPPATRSTIVAVFRALMPDLDVCRTRFAGTGPPREVTFRLRFTATSRHPQSVEQLPSAVPVRFSTAGLRCVVAVFRSAEFPGEMPPAIAYSIVWR
jgi:hypothetical protein